MRGMASFLAGMGGGYLKAREKTVQDERQARLDAQATDLHKARMTEIGDAQAERQRERDYRGAMETALSSGKTDAGFQVTDAAGSNAFTKDKDAAGVLADMAGTLNGGASTGAATRVLTGMQGATQRGTIPGQQVFSDPEKAQDFAKTMTMTDYTKLKARQDVAEQYAKFDVADDMRTKLENLAQKGVFQAYQQLDTGNTEGALKALQNANPNLVPGNATFKQVDVPDMFDRSKTVKGWSLVAPGAEGQPERVVVGDFRDAVFGYLSPKEQFDLKSKVSETELARRKTEVAEKQAAIQEKRWDAWIAGGAGGKSGGGSGGGGGGRGGSVAAAGVMPSPMEGFDSKKANAIAMEQAVAELSGQGKPPTAQAIAKRSTEIYRALEGEFKATGESALVAQDLRSLAGMAMTPAHLKAVADKAKVAGLNAAQIAEIDPRLAAFAQAKPSGATTTANPFAGEQPAAPVKADPASAPRVTKSPGVQPTNQEFSQVNRALQMGYQPVSRGNAVFGQGEILYVNPKTGDRKWASQLFTQFAQ